AADGVPVATPPGPVIASGVIGFNSDGTINMDPLVTTPGLSSLNINWAASSGLATQAVTLELNQTPGGLSQKRDITDIQSVTNDGTPFGSLAGVSVDEDGFVIASYNNGVSQRIGQVALATFPNPNALESVSGTAWGLSTDSGTFNLKVPGTGGSGKLAPFTL